MQHILSQLYQDTPHIQHTDDVQCQAVLIFTATTHGAGLQSLKAARNSNTETTDNAALSCKHCHTCK
jgi:hypothetical protein